MTSAFLNLFFFLLVGPCLAGKAEYVFGHELKFPKAKANRPADFNAYWQKTLSLLSQIPMEPKMEPVEAESNAKAKCFKVSYTSLKKVRVHAWYCRPTGEGRIYPGLLINPWYGRKTIEAPRYIAEMGYAVLTYQGRGYPVDLPTYPPDNGFYMTLGIEIAETYVYREMISHALRGLDFLALQPEVDPRRLGVAGSSQGGGLALIVAGLDTRVKAVAADLPYLAGISLAVGTADYPYKEVRDYLDKNPWSRENVLKTLSYFDALNFAPRIKAPVFVNVGLQDKVCPPDGIVAVYRNLGASQKELMVYPESAHSDHSSLRWWNALAFLNRYLAPQISGPALERFYKAQK